MAARKFLILHPFNHGETGGGSVPSAVFSGVDAFSRVNVDLLPVQ